MTASEAKANQDRLGEHVGWWYGTRCKKCCGVYPKFMIKQTFDINDCFYQCEVCGKRTTECYSMPWLAEKAWNSMEEPEQLNLMSMI